MLVNGTTFPQVTVQARRYRLAPPQRLQRPVPQPAALRRRRQPERNHPGCQRRPRPTSIREHAATGAHPGCRSAPRGASCEAGMKSRATFPSRIHADPDFPDPSTGQTDPSTDQKSPRRGAGGAARRHRRLQRVRRESVILYNDAPAPFPAEARLTTSSRAWTTQATRSTTTPIMALAPTPGSSCGSTWSPATGPADPPLNIGTGTDLTAGIDPFLIALARQQAGGPQHPGHDRTLPDPERGLRRVRPAHPDSRQ